MTSYEHLTSNQKIRAALHRDVQNICTETCHFLGLEITKSSIEIVTELVYKKLSVYGTDLEAFAKHAKRATINTDDVKLLVRRCPSLKIHLNTLTPFAPSSKEKKRKTIAGSRPTGSPTSKPSEPDQISRQESDKDIQNLKMNFPDISASTSKDKKDVESMIIDDVIDLDFE